MYLYMNTCIMYICVHVSICVYMYMICVYTYTKGHSLKH